MFVTFTVILFSVVCQSDVFLFKTIKKKKKDYLKYHTPDRRNYYFYKTFQASLVAQWQRICLPMQETCSIPG